MDGFVFAPAPVAAVEVEGGGLYPVRRIFCVGRNYVAHAAEMGGTVDREAPWYFTKSPAHLIASGTVLPYPPGTKDLHHEVEYVVALGATLDHADEAEARAAIWGEAVGLDMTRRDLQAASKEQRRPWDTSKDFEGAAVIGTIRPVAGAPMSSARLSLTVDGAVRQDVDIAEMVWPAPAALAHLSRLYRLGAGDLVMTGTPAGVAAVGPGQRLTGRLDGLAPVELEIGPAARD